MVGFLCTHRPRSVNSKRKGTEKFKEAIRESFKYYYSDTNLLDDELYGIAYYFHKKKTEIDADNLSKPIWDALETLLYKDDKIIKLRYTGIYDIKNDVRKLNITKMPTNVFRDFLNLIDNNQIEHLIYIELGKLNNSLYIIGGETHEII